MEYVGGVYMETMGERMENYPCIECGEVFTRKISPHGRRQNLLCGKACKRTRFRRQNIESQRRRRGAKKRVMMAIKANPIIIKGPVTLQRMRPSEIEKNWTTILRSVGL